jgi:hypothetical protein
MRGTEGSRTSESILLMQSKIKLYDVIVIGGFRRYQTFATSTC